MARLLFFASVREAAGGRRAEVGGDTLGAVMKAACARFGADFARLTRSCTVLVGDEAIPADRWWDVALGDSDEVGPAAGVGRVRSPSVITALESEPLDPSALVARIRRPDCGAVVVFEGHARTPNHGRDVPFLEYEAHQARAEGQLDAVPREVVDVYGLGGVVAVHRVGQVSAGDASVVVAAAAPHRDAALCAASELIDRIKAEAAVWKKEVFPDGDATWVESGQPVGAGRPSPRRTFEQS